MLGNQKLINVRKENRLSMYFGTVVYNFSCLIRLTDDAWVSGPDLAPQKFLLSQ